MNIAVFASHGGSDLQAIIDGCKTQQVDATVCAVISNNSDATALQRARKEGIDSYHISNKMIADPIELDAQILKILDAHHTDIIFLAGYLKKLGVDVLHKYKNRIFNIHPALLPKYGGKGMYGMNVHNAVIKANEQVSGVTVHRVTEEYDAGEIVAQTTVNVLKIDTPESLSERILKCEHTFLIAVIKEIIDGKIDIS